MDDETRQQRNRREGEFWWEQVRNTLRPIGDEVVIPGVGDRRIQLVLVHHFPPGGVAWNIHEGEPSWRLFRSEVVAVGDAIRLRGYDELEPPAGTLAETYDRLQRVGIRLGPVDRDQGRDGTTVHLAWSEGGGETRFRWWGGAARHWKPLDKIVDDLVQIFTPLPLKEPAPDRDTHP